MKDKQITADALRFWVDKKRVTQAFLAEKSGLAQNYISQIHTGKRSGSLDAIASIAKALEISLPEFFACKNENMPDIKFIPLVKAIPRAGVGGLEIDGDFESWYSFHSNFLSKKKGTPDTMRLFNIEGDSMEPTLFSGDMIMVNSSEEARHVQTGMIYLLRMENELMVKRLENRPGGILLIRSDNSNYEDIQVDKETIDGDIQIFGRMVWSCREY